MTSSQATLLLFEAIQSQLKLHATANQIEAASVMLFEKSSAAFHRYFTHYLFIQPYRYCMRIDLDKMLTVQFN